jgi:hypothetical protein
MQTFFLSLSKLFFPFQCSVQKAETETFYDGDLQLLELQILWIVILMAWPHFQVIETDRKQGCQMAYFQTNNSNLGKFFRVLQWKMLVYFMSIWSILWSFGLFYGHLVYLLAIWYVLWLSGMFSTVLVRCTNKNLATLIGKTTKENTRCVENNF